MVQNLLCKIFVFAFMRWALSEEGIQQIQCTLIVCPPPRKSLVKGERFIRSEGRPELTVLHRAGYLYCLTTRNTCGFCVISTIVFIPHSLHHEYQRQECCSSVTVNCVCIWRLCIVWLGRWQKTINSHD